MSNDSIAWDTWHTVTSIICARKTLNCQGSNVLAVVEAGRSGKKEEMQAAAFVILSEVGKKDMPLLPMFAMDKLSQFPAPNAGFH